MVDIRKHKKLFFIFLPITFVLTLGYVLGLPDYYECVVKLSPEVNSDSRSQNKMVYRLQLRLNNSITEDAITPLIYPTLLNSFDFKAGLMDIKIKQTENGREMTYYDYLMNYQKRPWWSSLFGKKKHIKNEKIDLFRLSPFQLAAVAMTFDKIKCEIDKQSFLLVLTVKDQDPLTCAIMADSVKKHLQQYIIDYRCKKVLAELRYQRKMLLDARDNYLKAQKEYALYADENQESRLQNNHSILQGLESDMKLKHDYYTAIENQVVQLEQKVQEEKPVLITIQSPTVPVEKSGPNRLLIIGWALLIVVVLLIIFIVSKEENLRPLLIGEPFKENNLGEKII